MFQGSPNVSGNGITSMEYLCTSALEISLAESVII